MDDESRSLIILEKNIGDPLQDIGVGQDFLEKTTETQAIKAKNKQLGLHQSNKFL